jgi:hypothetical protein
MPALVAVDGCVLSVRCAYQAALVGFYDPCVGEAKQLRIVYIFQRQRHEVTINDLDAVALPLRGTLAHSDWVASWVLIRAALPAHATGVYVPAAAI